MSTLLETLGSLHWQENHFRLSTDVGTNLEVLIINGEVATIDFPAFYDKNDFDRYNTLHQRSRYFNNATDEGQGVSLYQSWEQLAIAVFYLVVDDWEDREITMNFLISNREDFEVVLQEEATGWLETVSSEKLFAKPE